MNIGNGPNSFGGGPLGGPGPLFDHRMDPIRPPIPGGPIRDSNFNVIGNVDITGNITDPLGRPTFASVDSFGNIRDSFGGFSNKSLIGGRIQDDFNGRIINNLPEPFKPF